MRIIRIMNQKMLIGAAIIIILLLVLFRPWYAPIADKAAVRSAVEEFGLKLKSVSLLAPPETLRSEIRANYADLVAPELLENWLREPSRAPGRETSSPWPERLEMKKMEAADNGYWVWADVVEMTSTGEAGRYPVLIQVVPRGGKWLISSLGTVQY